MTTKVIMAAIIDQAARKFNADEADGVNRRHNLAMAHGFFYPERQRPERSLPMFADEVHDTAWDYVALGHHHVRADVSQGDVTAWYAGAPIAEWTEGDPDGSVLRVDLSVADGIRVRARPLA